MVWNLRGVTGLRCHTSLKAGGAEMKQETNADRLDELAEECSTFAEYCNYMAEAASPSFKDEWVRLAASWTKLVEEAKAESQPI